MPRRPPRKPEYETPSKPSDFEEFVAMLTHNTRCGGVPMPCREARPDYYGPLESKTHQGKGKRPHEKLPEVVPIEVELSLTEFLDELLKKKEEE